MFDSNLDRLDRRGEGALLQASTDIPEELQAVRELLQEQKPSTNQKLLPQQPEEARKRGT